MKRLWAPWRISYINNNKQKGCIFCAAKKARRPKYALSKTRHSICMLNIYPYNNGHVMVSPLRHVRDLNNLNDEEILDLFGLVKKIKNALDKVLKPEGYNIGINLSKAAGAGIAGHMHIHIVPRWTGDTNFMPVISDTKIISQSLDELQRKLKNALRT
jgi:ATP adenylyltransferase